MTPRAPSCSAGFTGQHPQGDEIEAVRWFERNRGALGPPGLFTEEFDVVQRQLRGSLPQAFVHALLVEPAITLDGPLPQSFSETANQGFERGQPIQRAGQAISTEEHA